MTANFYGVPFNYRDRHQRLLMTFAFLFAGTEDGAVGRVRKHVGLQGWRFGELVDEVQLIPLARWDAIRHRDWAEYLDRLPDAAKLVEPAQQLVIHLLPPIELR